ncbi:MAG TPA: IS1380 family transposase [Candidatus Acidoferrales bacterium]|nr:IS1380 family transposase [Candidatus Acidoferrales bacterium]
MARGPRKLRVSADGIGLTQFGGVALIEQFFQRIGLQGALWRHVRFAQRNNRYSISESLEALLYPLILGLGRIETTEPLRHNGVFHYLAGLPGYPEATSLRRFLQRFARAGRNALLKLHDHWRAVMLARPAQTIFDLDSTVLTVYGHQEQAQVGYNPKKRGRPSYLPLLCFEGRTQDCWEGSYHLGNTNASTVAIGLLERAFAKLPQPASSVRIRADAGFFDHKIIEFIEGKRGFYALVARLSRPLKHRLTGLRYRRVSPGVWAAEFRYCPQGWSEPRRFVVIRRLVPEEPSAQLALFQMGGYSYQVLVTNLALTPLHLWRFYNQRARAELIIRELKDAYGLGKIPTKDFAANEAFFQIVLLAYNLLNWFKRLCAPAHLQRATLQRLRQCLFLVPSQLVRPGGVPILRLAPSYPYATDFLKTLRRIRRLRSSFRVP